MHRYPKWLQVLIAAVAAVALLALRLVSLRTDSVFVELLFVAIVIGAVTYISRCSLRDRTLTAPFELAHQPMLHRASFVASAGFFAAFLSHSYFMYKVLTGGNATVDFIVTIVMSSLLSILSCVYFIVIALSYGDGNYDFREFNIIHIVPLFWTSTEIFSLIKNAGDFERDINSILKYGMLLLLLLFFYRFAREADENSVAKRSTVILARACACLSLLYFADRILLLLAGKAVLLSPENALAVTCVMLSSFLFFFQKDLVLRSQPPS